MTTSPFAVSCCPAFARFASYGVAGPSSGATPLRRGRPVWQRLVCGSLRATNTHYGHNGPLSLVLVSVMLCSRSPRGRDAGRHHHSSTFAVWLRARKGRSVLIIRGFLHRYIRHFARRYNYDATYI